MYKLVLKNEKAIIDFFISTNSDLSDSDNLFYLSISGKVVTVDGYCDEQEAFTCIEYPEYSIPLCFISHKAVGVARNLKNGFACSYLDISEKLSVTPQTAKNIFEKTLGKIKDIAFLNNNLRECLYA